MPYGLVTDHLFKAVPTGVMNRLRHVGTREFAHLTSPEKAPGQAGGTPKVCWASASRCGWGAEVVSNILLGRMDVKQYIIRHEQKNPRNRLFSFEQFIASLCVMNKCERNPRGGAVNMFLPYMKSARERLSHRLRSRGDLRRISAEAGLTHSWITKFLYGHINNPTIGNLGQLIRYLDATEGHTSCQPAPSPVHVESPSFRAARMSTSIKD